MSTRSRYTIEESNNIINMLSSNDIENIELAINILIHKSTLIDTRCYSTFYVAIQDLRHESKLYYGQSSKLHWTPDQQKLIGRRCSSIINSYGLGNYLLKTKYSGCM